MSEKDLVKELKAEIVEITKDRDDALDKVKAKEVRMKQVSDQTGTRHTGRAELGHKIGDQNKEIADLKAKLETKDKLLEEALRKIKNIYDDSTEKTEPEEIKTEDEE